MPEQKVITVQELKELIITDGVEGFELDEIRQGFFELRNTERAKAAIEEKNAPKPKAAKPKKAAEEVTDEV